MFGRKDKIEIKTPAQIDLMRKAGLVVATTLAKLKVEAGPGVTTNDLDLIAREELKKLAQTLRSWDTTDIQQ